MKPDIRHLESDNTASNQNNGSNEDQRTIDAQQANWRNNRLIDHLSENLTADGYTENMQSDDEIKIFEGEEEINLSDVPSPLDLDHQYDPVRIENVRKVFTYNLCH